ncbi:diacylglycerol kinase [Heliorestis acidaminivorans]|uniref:Diacylglycerol kinase n=1 Tax=Heliorestis acidaminivorans TaxID=553427 RepID=A0A6I0EZB2_9FIRM|nr:diacylglycerol kinase [Heliorestis acidaminivorans]KAB2952279.1 diacylglycerol kinase [Heliorestis acidaminivorans]
MKAKKILQAFYYAGRGLWVVAQQERNMKIHLVVTVAVLMMTLYYSLEGWELAWIILSTFLVLSAEMFNSAVEAVVDRCGEDYHPLAALAKDAAAGAVLLLALQALIAGIVVFAPKILVLWR